MPAVTPSTPVASDEEIRRYVNAYIATSNALGDAKIYLKLLEEETSDPQELLSIIIQRREIEDKYAANEQSFLAFHAESMSMHPPSQDQVDTLVELASEVAQLAAQKATAQMVFDVATSVAEKFDEIKG